MIPPVSAMAAVNLLDSASRSWHLSEDNSPCNRPDKNDKTVCFPGAASNWLSRHRHSSSKKFLLVPGADEMLRRLHGKYPMSVVSARDEKGTMRFLEQFDLVKYFDAIITGLSAEHTKPYPDPILLAARRMDVNPQACLMIGDTTVDIRAGKSAGAQTVGVLCGFGEKEELLRFGADLILETTGELGELLLNKAK